MLLLPFSVAVALFSVLRLELEPDFFAEVPFSLLAPAFFVAVCELVLVVDFVLVDVSVLVVHEATNATATAALRLRRRDFFMGIFVFR